MFSIEWIDQNIENAVGLQIKGLPLQRIETVLCPSLNLSKMDPEPASLCEKNIFHSPGERQIFTILCTIWWKSYTTVPYGFH